MASGDVILRFSDVTYEYSVHKPILNEASFSVKEGSKITLMGQNGAGKSTLFKMITGELKPKEGSIILTPTGQHVTVARQVIPVAEQGLTVKEFMSLAFPEVPGNIEKRIREVGDVVNYQPKLDQIVGTCSGGQQARLLLAQALISEPDILMLDEPTNNLDQTGLEHLTGYLMMYPKTLLVISHDADFLNAFSDGVLYLDSFTHKVEQYVGNYYDVVEQISARIERENTANARAESEVRRLKAQAEVFAHKGGKMRSVAKRMREEAEEQIEGMIDVRQEDRTIREFTIQPQEFDSFFDGKIVNFTGMGRVIDGEFQVEPFEKIVRRGLHVLLAGPNGIGKSTLLEGLVKGTLDWAKIAPNVRVGYYKQDFGMLDFDKSGYDTLKEVMPKEDEQLLRSTAAGFLIDGKTLNLPVGVLSEGQKGLLSFCRLKLMQPGLLVLDEPTNHINFRHLPVIAKALDTFEGAIVMVSHVSEFVSQVRIDEVIDLQYLT